MFKSVLSTKVIRMFTLFILMLLGLSVHGFTKQISSENATQRKQIESSASVKLIEVQDGVRLNIKNGTIIGLSLSEKIKDKVKWQDLIGSKYVIGDIHSTDVTPQLWRKLEVKLTKRDNSIAEITMLRPLWWIKLTKAKEGRYLALFASEVGIKGKARILQISRVKADSRKLKLGKNLVIGTIKHHYAKVIRLFLIGQKKSIGITPNHPIFSIDRNKWIPAGSVKIGEKLKVRNHSYGVIWKRQEVNRKQTVFNLEVHRSKTYYVGNKNLLVHNVGLDCNGTWINPKNHDNYVTDTGITSDGHVFLNLKADVGKNQPGHVGGTELFNSTIDHYAKNNDVKGVLTQWVGGANLEAFNRNMASGMTKEASAVGTFTGKMARRRGFTNVNVAQAKFKDGEYRSVSVYFTR